MRVTRQKGLYVIEIISKIFMKEVAFEMRLGKQQLFHSLRYERRAFQVVGTVTAKVQKWESRRDF